MVTHVPAPPGPRLCKVGLGAGQWELGLALGIKRKANLVEHWLCGGSFVGWSELEPHSGSLDSHSFHATPTHASSADLPVRGDSRTS